MRIILSCLLLFTFSNPIYTQISVDALLGGNLSFAKQYNYPQYFKPSYQFGFSLNVPISKPIVFQTGIKYQKKEMMVMKYKNTYSNGGNNFYEHNTLSQIINQFSLPLSIVYKIEKNKKIQHSIIAGIQYNFSAASYFNSTYTTKVSGTNFAHSSGASRIHQKRSFTQIENLNDPTRALTNMFIPALYLEYNLAFYHKFSISLFYEYSLYEHYIKTFADFDNFNWQTIGFNISYPIFAAKSKTSSNL